MKSRPINNAQEVDFRLVGGPHDGKIVAVDNPFTIETQMVPRLSNRGLVYDLYTRREWFGIFFYVHEDVDDQTGQIIAKVRPIA